MNDFLITGIFFGGFLALTAAAGQLVTEGKDRRKYLLSSLMFCIGVWQIYLGFLYYGILEGPTAFFRMSHIPVAFCTGPLLYLFLKDIVDPDFQITKNLFLHFIPALLVFIYMVPLYFIDPQTKIEIESFSHNLLQSSHSQLTTNAVLRFYFYSIAWIASFPKISMLFYSGSLLYFILKFWSRKDSIWLRMRIALLLSIVLISIASFSAWSDHFLEGENFLRMGGFVASVCVFVIYLLDRRYFEPLRIRNKTREYKNSRIKGLNKDSLREMILTLMDSEKVFLTEDLSLQMLSKELNENGFEINSSQLSEFINGEFGKNYNQFLNEYRIEEACVMLQSEPERSILSIALAAGFNSKSTFNRVFKQIRKITPLEHREKNRVKTVS
ncbi:helix-turn-helix transcriptional regulator [Leptospira sp. 201903071]|uniref:helix-turn-helix domain-containing protein n=1 Tax=Leptospira ainazelensis TaxID=2810034 RepID=UPI00196324A2|nr:helix-turn-helix transcriptional regulator [Leptospira ainazelensis]